MRYLSIGSFLVLATAATAQRTWVVDDDGGVGVDFTAIQPAIDAAAPNDIIRVRAGSYSGFDLGKPLAILGSSGVQLEVISARITVHDLPAGSSTTLTDLQVLPLFATGILVRDCAGTVTFERTELQHSSNLPQAFHVVRNAADVRFSSCDVVGVAHFEASHVTLTDSVLRTAQLMVGEIPAVELQASTVVSSRCQVSGSPEFGRFLAASAIAMDATSRLVLTGDGSGAIRAGDSQTRPVDAIVGAGSVLRDPRVTVTGSRGGVAVNGPSDAQREIASLQALGASLGGTVQIDLAARPGQLFALVLGLPIAPLPLPAFGGDLGTTPTLVVAQGVIDASGRFALSLPASNTVPEGTALSWQAVAGSAAQLQLSNVATYVRTP